MIFPLLPVLIGFYIPIVMVAIEDQVFSPESETSIVAAADLLVVLSTIRIVAMAALLATLGGMAQRVVAPVNVRGTVQLGVTRRLTPQQVLPQLIVSLVMVADMDLAPAHPVSAQVIALLASIQSAPQLPSRFELCFRGSALQQAQHQLMRHQLHVGL
jgi:hypothetical protein